MDHPLQSFAIVPAAGRSRRMQGDKLLMPWGKTTIIEQVLANWQQSRIDHVVVVVRPSHPRLADVCRHAGADVVVPATDPEEMKSSVQHALRYIEETFRPADTDAWLLAPADMPSLSPSAINRVIDSYEALMDRVLVPTVNGKRGHPALFPWLMRRSVFQLGPDEGVNVLVERYVTVEVPINDPSVLQDVDTREDFERVRNSGEG